LTITLSSSIAAGIHHPDMAKGKIVPDWIKSVDRAQGCRNFGRHLPVWCAIARQSEAPPQSDDVRIERNDEPRRGHECPRSKVNFVTPNHPAQKQIEPLARASSRRSGEEITDARPLRHSAVSRTKICAERASGKGVERGSDIRSGEVVACNEETLDGTGFPEHSLQDEQQRDEIPTPDPAVNHGIDGCSIAFCIEVPHEAGRMRPHGREQRLDRVQDACDATKGERGGAESDDLAVLRRSVAPDDVNRVGRRVDVIERAVKIIQTRRKLAPRIPNPESRVPAAIVISGTA